MTSYISKEALNRIERRLNRDLWMSVAALGLGLTIAAAEIIWIVVHR